MVSVRALIRDELNVDSIFLVVKTEPVSELLARDHLQIHARLFVLEILGVLLLLRVQQMYLDFVLDRVLDLIAHHLDILEQHHRFEGAKFERLHCVVHTEADVARVECDFFEELADDLLLLYEFNVGERVLSKLDCLIETLVETVGDIDSAQNQRQKTLVETIRLLQIVLELSTSSNNETLDVRSVI